MSNNIGKTVKHDWVNLNPESEVNLVCGAVTRATCDTNILWEETIKLKVKPRPKHIPERLWRYLINMVLIQEYHRGYK